MCPFEDTEKFLFTAKCLQQLLGSPISTTISCRGTNGLCLDPRPPASWLWAVPLPRSRPLPVLLFLTTPTCQLPDSSPQPAHLLLSHRAIWALPALGLVTFRLFHPLCSGTQAAGLFLDSLQWIVISLKNTYIVFFLCKYRWTWPSVCTIALYGLMKEPWIWGQQIWVLVIVFLVSDWPWANHFSFWFTVSSSNQWITIRCFLNKAMLCANSLWTGKYFVDISHYPTSWSSLKTNPPSGA